MRLYHFLDGKHIFDIISNHRIRISTIYGLNDPYEMMPALDIKGVHAPVDYVWGKMRAILKNVGLFCLTPNIKSPAMWAHYGIQHKGIALEFNFTQKDMKMFTQVKYSSKRVVIKDDDDLSDPSVMYKIGKKLIKRKAPCWAYENEYRWVLSLFSPNVFMDDKGVFFFNMPKQLKRIVLGIDCTVTEAQVKKALLSFKELKDIGVTKSRMHDSRFEIVIDSKSHAVKNEDKG